MSYDFDGNLTADGSFAYTWDAENRLVSVAPASSPVEGDKKLVFTYDYMSRRVRKRVYDRDASLNGGAGGWTAVPSMDRRFVYDGWSVLLELDGLNDNAVLRKYTWGLDLSGLSGEQSRDREGSVPGMRDAGGIGGLLAAHDVAGSKDYIYLYDGNGNVGQLVE